MPSQGTGNGAVVIAPRRRADGYLVCFEERPDTGYRAYHLQAPDSTRERFPSCTTVLDRIHPKQALLDWYERMGAEGAVRVGRAGKLRGVQPEDAIDVVRAEAAGAKGASGKAKDRGHTLHRMLEAYARSGAVPNPADYPEQLHGYIRALGRWLLAARPEPTAVERLVAHRGLRYAGRLDLRAQVRGLDTIVDLKSRPRAAVYFDDTLQVVGYDLADQDCGEPPAEQLLVVAIAPDGTYAEDSPPEGLSEAWTRGLAYHNIVEPLERAFQRRRRAA